NENFEVTYGLGTVHITKKPLYVSADNKFRDVGEPNPEFTFNYDGFAFDDSEDDVCVPLQLPPSPKSIDQLERRTTYTDVKINGLSNVYYATPGENLTLTGSWSEVYFSDIIPGFIPYCPGCVTQNYVGMANDQFSGNIFDPCYDVSGTFPHSGTLSNTFTAPPRPGVYYITQQSSWYFSCYQFGHLLHDQIANDAIAVVIINPSSGITGNTTATDASPAGDYPIMIGGCHFNSNYRIVFQDGILTVGQLISSSIRNDTRASQTQVTERTAVSRIEADMLYPNPASSILRLQLKDDVQTIKDIQVYDGVGKLNPTSSRKVNDGLYEINVSGLSRGIYIIEARTAAGIKTFKFIKL
ncbi:MAG: T9SS type A sorting domain-containing protein, partial [Saprospiraceae bacterium]|nr:T9SS type A sorting domain-containing protein [Saprospiraceae bacterium]